MAKVIHENLQLYQEQLISHEREIGKNSPVLLIVRSLPSVGEDQEIRTGGTGSTSIAKELAAQLTNSGIPTGLILTGQKMREYFRNLTFGTNPVSDLDFNTAFYAWRAQLDQEDNKTHDEAVDTLIRQEVIELSKKYPVIVIDSKVFSDIPANQIFPHRFVIGVTANDEVASKRMGGRDKLFDQIQKTRSQRYHRDLNLYKSVYGIDFSPEAISATCNIIIDNSENWQTPEDPQNFAQELINYLQALWIITQEMKTAPLSIITAISGD